MYTNKWLNEIIAAINSLNGEGSLDEIYNQVKKSKSIDLSSYTDWKAQIRKNIYLYSSDCDIFKGSKGDERDLFYATDGKGSGKWGIRKPISQLSILPFILNQDYKRSDLHDSLGGNRQRGISPSREYPIIFIFSGKEGKEYGYKDGWQDQTTFFYSGEGQIGPQEFKEGNKALKEHIENGKDVFLFEKNDKSSTYKYKGQLTLIGYQFVDGPDKFGDIRKIIVFEFETIEKVISEVKELTALEEINELSQLRKLAIDSNEKTNSSNVLERKHIVRTRAAAVKKYALLRASGLCEACEQPAPFNTIQGQPFLEVHHLYRLSDGGMDLPENVAAICPNCHRRVHYSDDSVEYNSSILKKIAIKESAFSEINL